MVAPGVPRQASLARARLRPGRPVAERRRDDGARAPSSSVSGWHETSGCAIVNRIDPNRPRAAALADVPLRLDVRRGRRGTDDVEAELVGRAGAALRRSCEDRASERASGSTRTAAPRSSGTRTSPTRSQAPGQVLVRLRGRVAQPPRRLGAQRPSLGAQAADPRCRRGWRRRGARRGRRRSRRRRPCRPQPGHGARRRHHRHRGALRRDALPS